MATENLPYRGESPSDIYAYQRYLADVKRGKSLLQLMAVRDQITPEIRKSWSARSFTPVQTSEGIFDDLVCNISYHFDRHGAKYGDIAALTRAAQQYFRVNRAAAVVNQGLLRFPNGSKFEQDGRIVTFF